MECCGLTAIVGCTSYSVLAQVRYTVLAYNYNNSTRAYGADRHIVGNLSPEMTYTLLISDTMHGPSYTYMYVEKCTKLPLS